MRNKFSLCRGDVGVTCSSIVGHPSGDRRYSRLKHIAFVLLFLMAGLGQVWAADYDLVYTLDGTVTNGGNSNYGQDGGGLTQNDIAWSVIGNTTTNPWRIGGKNLTKEDRIICSKTAISDDIVKIEIEHGGTTLTVNSLMVEVATDDEFETIVSTLTPTCTANKTAIIEHPLSDEAWENCYYRFTYNVTAGGSNSYVQVKSIKFYKEKEEVTTPTITADVNEIDFGEKNIYFETNKTGSAVVKVTGLNLTEAISATLGGTDANKFSLSSASLDKDAAEAELTVSYNIEATGDYAATLTLASDGATEVVISIALKAISENVVVDVLTRETTGITGTSYNAWTEKTLNSEAVYAGGSAGGNGSIQLRQDNSKKDAGIYTTTSGGKVKKVVVDWNTNTTDGRTLNVYGKNTAYTALSDLYGAETQGELLGTIVKGTNTELVITGDYMHIGLRATAAMYLNSVSISWAPAQKYAVTFANPTNGSLTVKKSDVAISSGAEFAEGTALAIETEPNEGYLLDELKAYKTGDESTEVTIANGAFEMPAYDVTVVATFKENEAPDATLTLSENGVEHNLAGSHKLGDVVTLPTTSTADCSKVLVGWDADENCTSAPTYPKGGYFTLSEISQKLYAVYAKATLGAVTNHVIDFESEASSYTEWTFTNISSGETDSGVTAHGDSKFGVTDGKGTGSIQTASIVANPSSLTVYVSKKSTNTTASTWKIQVSENGSSWTDVASANGASMDKGKWVELSGDLSSYKNVYVRVYYDGSTAVRCIDDLVLAEQGAPTYSDYATTCAAPLAAPTFSVEAGEYTEAKSIELNAAEGTIYYTLDGTTPDAESTKYTEAIVLDKCGTTTIKAIAISADNESAVAEAAYTLEIPIPANSQASPYTPAQAISVIDDGCYDGETIIYVKGVVKTSSGLNTTYLNYDNVVVVAAETTSPEFTFYRLQKTAEDKFETTDPAIVEGDTIIAAGKLLKHTNGTYELASGCYLVERKEFKAQKEAIVSSLEAPLSVAQAIGYINNGIIYDLSQEVYVKAVANAAPNKYGTFTGHDADAENAFQFYNADLNDFTIGANDTVIVKGIIKLVSTNYRMEPGVVQSVKVYVEPPVVVTGVTVKSTASVEVGKTLTLTAEVQPANAANKNVTWSVKTGGEYAEVDANGVVTGLAVGEAVIEVKTEDGNFTATCTVTVTPAFAYYNYEKVTATADITDGEYLIVYEGDATHDAVAFNGGLEKLDAAGNGIAVDIEDNVILGKSDLHAATFTIDVTAGTLQSASGNYIGKTANSNGLDESDQTVYTNTFAITDGVAVITASGNCTLRYNYGVSDKRFRYYKSGQQAIALYKKVGTNEAPKATPELAFDPETVTLKLGEDFTAPSLGYAEGFDGLESVTYVSDNTEVAEVGKTTGAVTIKAVGEATITATFAGNENYKADAASYTITVKAADTPDPVEGDKYVKVTTTPTDWSGDYLLVYEEGTTAYAWDGTDNANNGKTATISENKIVQPDGAAVLTIAAVEGGYTIRINGDKYLKDNGNNSNIRFAENEEEIATVDITIEEDGWAKIMFSERCIRFNNLSGNNGMRFRNYATDKQNPVQLYKKETEEPVEPAKEVIRGELFNGKWGTLCPKQDVEDVEGAVFYQISYLEEQGGLPYNMVFDEIEGKTLTAGKPYFFIANASEIKGVKSGEELTEAGSGENGFYGYIGANGKLLSSWHTNYEAGKDNTYVIYNNKVVRLNGDTYLPGERCYININATEPSRAAVNPAPARRRITMGVQNTNVATGLENDGLMNDELIKKVLINGQLYIMYNGTMYNVQGQLVK